MIATGQSGPAGVGNSATNAVWLDASYPMALNSGAKVSQWTDRSGNGRSARQTTVANQPSLLTNSLNGRSVLRFDRSQAYQYLEIAGGDIGAVMSNSNTIFAVFKANSGGIDNTFNTGQTIFAAVGYHSGLLLNGYPTTNAFYATNWVNGNIPGSASATTNVYQPISQGSWFLSTVQNQETTNATITNAYINGGAGVSNSQPFSMANYNNHLVRIGATNPPGNYSWPLNGEIAEIIVYREALSPTKRTIVENYLAVKYNLPTGNKLYTAQEPSYILDLQAIGTLDGTDKNTSAKSGQGLTLAELNNTLNAANEFVFAAHSSNSNTNIFTDVPTGIEQRWERNWYVQLSGQVDAKVGFDFSDAGLAVPASFSAFTQQYRLLYRPTLASAFQVVTVNGNPLLATLENGDELTFACTNLASGYYTLGKLAGTTDYTGPAGVGSVSTNALWLDASRLTLSNGAKVATFTDRSGNGRSALQANAANQPTYLLNSLNGRSVLRFDRSQAYQFLEISGGNIGTVMSNSHTIFTVAKVNTSSIDNNNNAYSALIMAEGYHSGLMTGGYPVTDKLFSFYWTGGAIPIIQPLIQPPIGSISTNRPISQSQWFIASARTLETSTNVTVTSAINSGTEIIASKEALLTDFNNHIVRIGASVPGGNYSWPLNGEIAEIIMYNEALSLTKRIIVENYLAAKYNLPIEQGKDFYTTHDPSYTHDVQGVGTIDGVDKQLTARNGGGLQLMGSSSSLNLANSFLFSAHNNVPATASSADLPPGVSWRWQRCWYVQKTGAVQAGLAFDFAQAGTALPADLGAGAGNYRLLYRATASGAFQIVTNADNTPLLAGVQQNRLVFPLEQNTVTGYYTLAKLPDSYVWKSSAQSSEWNQPQNWEQGAVPLPYSNVVVNSCSQCPALPASVVLNSLALNAGSRLDLKGFSLTVALSLRIDQSRLDNSMGTESVVKAASISELKDSFVTGLIRLEKTGETTDSWAGGNRFQKKIRIVNTSASGATINMATQKNDTVER